MLLRVIYFREIWGIKIWGGTTEVWVGFPCFFLQPIVESLHMIVGAGPVVSKIVPHLDWEACYPCREEVVVKLLNSQHIGRPLLHQVEPVNYLCHRQQATGGRGSVSGRALDFGLIGVSTCGFESHQGPFRSLTFPPVLRDWVIKGLGMSMRLGI